MRLSLSVAFFFVNLPAPVVFTGFFLNTMRRQKTSMMRTVTAVTTTTAVTITRNVVRFMPNKLKESTGSSMVVGNGVVGIEVASVGTLFVELLKGTKPIRKLVWS